MNEIRFEKIIPDHIIELLNQCIDMVEGKFYPKYMVDLVPGRLRKIVEQLERRNSPEYIRQLREKPVMNLIEATKIDVIERFLFKRV